MASSLQNLSEYNPGNIPAGDAMLIGVVVSAWNPAITHALYDGCLSTLLQHGVKEENIFTIQVPGSFELPVGARMLSHKHSQLDAVICLGCVIKGETKHDEYINSSVASGLTSLSIAYNKPFVFGVLTPDNEQQAMDRAGGKYGNKGVEAAVTALRMAALRKELTKEKGRIGF